jgi:blue copper oxidase
LGARRVIVGRVVPHAPEGVETLVLQNQNEFIFAVAVGDSKVFVAALLGFRGDVIAVNGQIDPYLDVPQGLVRLRLLNASNARFFTLSFADGRPLTLIGTDAGRLTAPLPLSSLRMAPAERCDVLVDFSNGAAVMLMSRPDSNSGMSLGPLRGIKNTLNTGLFRSFQVLEFRPLSAMKSSFSGMPAKLKPAPAQSDRAVSQIRHFTLDMSGGESGMEGMTMKVRMTINGQLFDMARSDFRVALGSSERWIVSTVMMAHPFHVHGCRFKVISEDGAPPRPENTGWKDVVGVEKQVELIAEFDNLADDSNPYMYHCHILEHEDAGMMGQFSVGEV